MATERTTDKGIGEFFPPLTGRYRNFYLLSLALAVILPMLALLAYAWFEAVERDRESVTRALDVVQARTDLVLGNARKALVRVARETGGACDAKALKLLRALAYAHAAIREFGIVRDGKLSCTSWGMTEPPAPIGPEHGREQRGEFAIFRLDRPLLGFAQGSLMLQHAMGGGDYVNALINPVALFSVLDGLAAADLRVAVASVEGEEVYSARYDGRLIEPPLTVALSALFTEAPYVRQARRLASFPVRLVADKSRRNLYLGLADEFLLHLCLGVIAAVLLIYLATRHAQRQASPRVQFRAALRANQFDVHYQPIMDLDRGGWAGTECLLRWRHPELGVVPTARFIAHAEATGAIVPITERLVRQMTEELAPTLRAYPQRFVSINLCRAHFDDADAGARLERLLEASGLLPSQIKLEITERSLIDHGDEHIGAALRRLRARGYGVALDDFGTGYNGLLYLQQYPFDTIKVDQIFVQAIATEALTSGLVDRIIDISRTLGLGLIAEGVEEPRQEAYLRARGVHLVQGWLYAPAMAIADFLAFVAKDPEAREH